MAVAGKRPLIIIIGMASRILEMIHPNNRSVAARAQTHSRADSNYLTTDKAKEFQARKVERPLPNPPPKGEGAKFPLLLGWG